MLLAKVIENRIAYYPSITITTYTHTHMTVPMNEALYRTSHYSITLLPIAFADMEPCPLPHDRY
jgi:hypothetical protein